MENVTEESRSLIASTLHRDGTIPLLLVYCPTIFLVSLASCKVTQNDVVSRNSNSEIIRDKGVAIYWSSYSEFQFHMNELYEM